MNSSFTALFDANVFFGARLRSLIVYLAQTGTFRAKWTSQIHDEWTRNLVELRPDLTIKKLQRTRDLMDTAVPDCLVENYEPLIPAIVLPDQDDRHVVAAAIKGQADVIVTFNIKDFPKTELEKYDLHVKTPDEFILDLESLHKSTLMWAAEKDQKHYKSPPLTIDQYLVDLRKAGVPGVADYLKAVMDAVESIEPKSSG